MLGTWLTPGDALAAARDMLAMRGEKRLASPADIVRVRKELAGALRV